MLNPQIAQSVIDHALFQGADFCDLFVEKSQLQRLRLLNSVPHEISSGVDSGIGIRLIYGSKVLYGFTNSFDKEELMRITSILSANDIRKQVKDSVSLDFMKPDILHSAINTLNNDISFDEKINFLKQIDKVARSVNDKIIQVSCHNYQKRQSVEIFNSEGLHISDERNYIRVSNEAIASQDGEEQTGNSGFGALKGAEFYSELNTQQMGVEAADMAITKLSAIDCPAGKMPVVIDNGFGGVIFHEACGHGLETTAVAKKASVFHDKLGQMIASDCVNAVDDGTLVNEWGSSNIDDEGIPTQRTQLITNGKLTSFMVDRVGSLKTGYERTGSGRRAGYRYAPTSRMRNTFIDKGDSKLEDMISSIENGIYAKKMGGGSVSPGTGEFNFAVGEGYLIENGKITSPIKSATLIGTGEDVLKKISMVGDDLKHAPGMCGSASGPVPTNVGQPALKVDEILVGGKA